MVQFVENNHLLLDLLELLSLLLGLWKDLLQVGSCLIHHSFQVLLLLLNLLDKVLCILNDVSCLINLFVEKLAFESLVLFLQEGNLIQVFFDQFFLLWQLAKNDLLLLKVSLDSIEVQRKDVLVDDWLIY